MFVRWWPHGASPKSVQSSWCDSQVSGCQLECLKLVHAQRMFSAVSPLATCGFPTT